MPDEPDNETKEQAEVSEGDFTALIETIVKQKLDERDEAMKSWVDFFTFQTLMEAKTKMFDDLQIKGGIAIDVNGKGNRWVISWQAPILFP